MPAALDVARRILHRHLLSDLGLFALLFVLVLVLALATLLCVLLDQLDDLRHLLTRLCLALLDQGLLSIDLVDFSLALVLLLLILLLKMNDALVQVPAHGLVHFALSVENVAEVLDLLLKLGLLFLMEAVLARLRAQYHPIHVLDVQVLLDLGLVLLALQLGHLLSVFVLFTRVLVLQSLVLGRRLLNLIRQCALLLL